jgi:HEAT repeat protein
MKKLLIAYWIVLFLFLESYLFAPDQSYYLQLLSYGTDSDIEKAFSQVKNDLGNAVNKKVLGVFSEEHAEKVYLSIIFYIGRVDLKEANDVLLQELDRNTGSEDYRETVIRTLGQLKEPRSLPMLTGMLGEPRNSIRVRKALLDSIGDIGEKESEDALLGIAKDAHEDVEVRAHAILSIGKVKSEKSVPFLRDILHNVYEEKILRMYAASSLSLIGGSASLEALSAVIGDETHEVAEYAVNGIAQMKTKEGGELLLRALRSDNDKVRYYAAAGLGEIGYTAAADALRFRAAYDTNDLVRKEAKKSLEKMGIDREERGIGGDGSGTM